MIEPRRFGPGELVLLLAVLAAAGGARAYYLRQAAGNGTSAGPVIVQGEAGNLDTLVDNLKAGRGFVERPPLAGAEEASAFAAPGYPWLLSLVARFDIDLKKTVRWAQAGLGALTAGLYFLFARRAFRSTLVAALAGFFAAFYPFWIIDTAELADGVLASFLLALALFLGARGGQTGGVLTSVFYGLSLAALALVRAACLPFALVAVLWFLFRCRTLPRGWFYAILAFLGFANGLAPWIMRNIQTLGGPLPIVDSTYFHLWVGNNDRATGGPESEATMRDALSRDVTPEQLSQFGPPDAAGQGTTSLSSGERSRLFATAFWNGVRNDPSRFLANRIWAGLCFVFGESWFMEHKLWQDNAAPAGQAPDDQATGHQAPHWFLNSYPAYLIGSLLVLLLLAVLGWRWSYAWRYEAMPAALAVVWIPLPYLLSHAESLSGPRLPLDGVFLCYTALVVACLFPPVGRSLLRGSELPGARIGGKPMPR